jgi:hypothetical protein
METSSADLQAWREVHKRLTEAVIVAKEAVAAAKSQRRYWLEEIAANLTPEGKLTATSPWKKTIKPKSSSTGKRKSLAKRSEDTETDDDDVPIAKLARSATTNTRKSQPKALAFQRTMSQQSHEDNEDDDKEEEEEEDDEEEDEMNASTGSALETSGSYTKNDDITANALLGNQIDADMSHIPEELRPFMASMDVGLSLPAPVNNVSHTSVLSYGGKSLRPYDDDDDEDDDDEDDISQF